MDERELILRARVGDRESFNELVKAHQKRIFFVAYRLLRNSEDAAELTQEAFISAYQAIKGFRLRASFYTWIYRIATNLAYHKLKSADYRNKLKTKSLEDPVNVEDTRTLSETIASTANPCQELLAKEQREIIYQGLASLKRKFYQAVVLRDLEGISYKEIAQIQNCSLGTVMSRLSRGRKQLAEKLKKSGINLP